MNLDNKDTVALDVKDTLLTKTEVCAICKISNTTLWRWIKCGKFPKGINITARKRVWKRSTIEKWIETLGTVADAGSVLNT